MRTLFLTFITLLSLSAPAQSKLTKTAFVSFYSELEDVTATNYSGTSQLNIENGSLLFSFAIQSFYFENSLMQKHFNEEDVMNSREFPRAKFVGQITNNSAVQYNVDGDYKVNVKGQLTIKGKTNPIALKGDLKIINGKIEANASFSIDRYTFGVDGKEDSISQILEIKVKAVYE